MACDLVRSKLRLRQEQMPWATSIETFRDFFLLVIVHAPNGFPQEDFLEPHEQLNRDSSFQELRHDLSLMDSLGSSATFAAHLANVLDASLATYRAGDDISGAHLLQDFESQAFGAARAPHHPSKRTRIPRAA